MLRTGPGLLHTGWGVFAGVTGVIIEQFRVCDHRNGASLGKAQAQ